MRPPPCHIVRETMGPRKASSCSAVFQSTLSVGGAIVNITKTINCFALTFLVEFQPLIVKYEQLRNPLKLMALAPFLFLALCDMIY